MRDASETPRSAFREHKPWRNFMKYMVLMSSIIDVEPSSFEEVPDQQVWQDVVVEEYTSIMRNYVWDIVSRLERKSVVILRWLYNIKNVAYGSIEKFKVRYVVRGIS
jgi:hypothetical protein